MERRILILLLAVLGGGAFLLWMSSQAAPGSGKRSAGRSSGAPAAAPALQAPEAPDRAAAGAPETPSASGRVTLDRPPAAGTAPVGRASLAMRLLDSADRPVQEAEARAVSRLEGFRPRFGLIGLLEDTGEDGVRGRPDREGRLRLDGLQPGIPLVLEVGGPHRVLRSIWVAPLAAGEHRDLGTVFLKAGNRISGRVFGPGGAPVSGARVQLRSAAAASQHFRLLGQDASPGERIAVSRADGGFELPGVPAGTWQLTAEADGFLAGRLEALRLAGKAADVKADLHLGTGATLTGRVLGPGGRPVPGARVGLLDRDAGMRPWSAARLLTDGRPAGEDGRFTLTGLDPEAAVIVGAAAEGFLLARSGRVRVGEDLELHLSPAVALQGRVLTRDGAPVAGAVLELSAVAPPGPMAAPRVATSGDDGRFSLPPAAAGEYRLEVSSWAGPVHILEALRLEPGMQPLELRIHGGDPVVIRVRDAEGAPIAGARVILKGSPPAGTAGEAGRREIRRIETDGEVYFDDGSHRVRGRTGPGGVARFYALPAGSWTATARAEGYSPGELGFDRPLQAEQEFELVLAAPGGLRVEVVDATGQPVPRSPVSLQPLDGQAVDRGQALSDDQGLVVWSGLAPGPYEAAQAADPGGFVAMGSDVSFRIDPSGEKPPPRAGVPVEVVAGRVAEVRLTVAEKAVARVQVTRVGDPVTGAEVRLVSAGGEEDPFTVGLDAGGGPSGTTDGRGWAELPPADAGTYTLKARAGSGRPWAEKEVQLLPGPQDLAMELPTGAVQGTLLGSRGPKAGVQVKLVPAAAPGAGDAAAGEGVTRGSFIMVAMADGSGEDPVVESLQFTAGETVTVTGADGRWQFEDVPAGSYRVEASAEGVSPWESPAFAHDGRREVDLGTHILEEAGSLHGRILGMPVPDSDAGAINLSMVELLDAAQNLVTISPVKSDGGYRFSDLKPGRYFLRFQDGRSGSVSIGSGPVSEPVEVLAGPPTRFDYSVP